MGNKAIKLDEPLDGSRIAGLRVEAGLTQEELAGLTGINRITIGHIENGAKTPSLGALFRLAEALKCQPGDLLPRFDGRTASPLSPPPARRIFVVSDRPALTHFKRVEEEQSNEASPGRIGLRAVRGSKDTSHRTAASGPHPQTSTKSRRR